MVATARRYRFCREARKSKRTKAQAKAFPVINPRDVDFGYLWRQLARVGWATERPTQLSNSWSYYMPNVRKDPHVEGVNMFLGELAVVIYAIVERIVSANADSYDVTLPKEPEEPDDPEECEQRGEPDESDKPDERDELFGPKGPQDFPSPHFEDEIRPSQIDTSIALSANTIDDVLRGARSGDEEEVAVVLANAAAEAANLIPDEVDVVLLQGLNTQDVNVMKDGENTDEYEGIGSEADNSGWSDDDHVERRQINEGVSSDEEEVSLTDEAFIDV
ncbi:hypothetical protein PI124_g16626 [Phytophthora idaei]|nr:hypothetical protein PI125_g22451 [Phytophthora idaei]KAG3134340.1 hypothetical protein PI126_g18729 [Phytophthora idaei]KAG3238413.1 hypothetical protein PI124_g16626 [Phytophthora idaei]